MIDINYILNVQFDNGNIGFNITVNSKDFWNVVHEMGRYYDIDKQLSTITEQITLTTYFYIEKDGYRQIIGYIEEINNE